MALLDHLINAVVSAVAGDKAPALKQFLKDNGGIAGLREKFSKAGLSETFSSWVKIGENVKVTPQQVEAVMGSEKVKAFATMLGIDTTKATEYLAATLPALVDKLTPDGKVPDADGAAPALTAPAAAEPQAAAPTPAPAAAPAAPQVQAAPLAPEKANALEQFLKDNGGVAGLYEKFRNGGLAREFASWVSTGANELITPAQIEAVMGNEKVKALATLLGIDITKATEFLARTLPALIDRLTPDGKIPEEAGVVASAPAPEAPAPPSAPMPPATAPGEANG
jgi:uncharacterized protein YidB (DUF937 family)